MYRERRNEMYNCVSFTGRIRLITFSRKLQLDLKCIWCFHQHPLKQDVHTARDIRQKTCNTARVQLTLYYWIVHHFMCNTSPKTYYSTQCTITQRIPTYIYCIYQATVGSHGCTAGIHFRSIKLKLGSCRMSVGATSLRRSHALARLRKYCESTEVSRQVIRTGSGAYLDAIGSPVSKPFVGRLAEAGADVLCELKGSRGRVLFVLCACNWVKNTWRRERGSAHQEELFQGVREG